MHVSKFKFLENICYKPGNEIKSIENKGNCFIVCRRCKKQHVTQQSSQYFVNIYLDHDACMQQCEQ